VLGVWLGPLREQGDHLDARAVVRAKLRAYVNDESPETLSTVTTSISGKAYLHAECSNR
jgi:hypothetical protein